MSDFTAIMNENNKSVEKNQEDLDDIEDKIAQTQDYLDWNEKRRNQNNMKLEVLAE